MSTIYLLDRIDTFLDKIASPIYFWLIGLLYIVYLAAFLGMFYVNPAYIRWLSIAIQVFISGVLLIRFNPFYKHVVHDGHNVLVFACAFFLLMNVGLTESVLHKIQTVWSTEIAHG